MGKKLILISLVMLLSLGSLLTACGGSTTTSSAPAGSSAENTAGGKYKYAIVFSGSRGDLGFIDEGYAGMEMARDTLGISFDYAECKAPSDYEPQLRL